MTNVISVIGLASVLFLAGCGSPATTRDDPAASEPANSLDVDLHEYLLNITMPEGQPTMLVALNVTKDMWVRPFAGMGMMQATDPTFWVLCPWVRSFGLRPDVHYGHFPFWLDQSTLTAATHSQDWQDGWGDADGGHCAALTHTYGRRAAIASDQPFDGTLVLILAARPDRMTFPRVETADAVPEFHLVVGIARAACPTDAAALCPPSKEVRADPLVRAGMLVDAHYNTQGPACDRCGFDIRDNTTRVETTPQAGGAFSVGTLSASRTGDIANGFTIARADSNGPTEVELQLFGEGTPIRASCTGDLYGYVWILASHQTALTMLANFDMKATPFWGIAMKQIPIDLAALGWTFSPTIQIETYRPILTGTTGSQCS